MKNILITSIICLMSIGAFTVGVNAQNDVQFTHFMFNKMGYNPAFAGYDDALSIGVLYREQWLGIDGAPRSIRAQAHTPFAKDRNGIGLSIVSDKIGWANTNTAELSYAYRIPVGKNRVTLGLSGRLENMAVDWTQAIGVAPSDAGLPVGETSLTTPNFGAGITFSGDRFYVSASIPQFLENSNSKFSEAPNDDFEYTRTSYLMAGAEFSLSEKVDFMPTALLSYNPNAPVDVDINLGFMFVNTFYTGLSYRWDDSFDLLLMYQLTPQFRVGGAYDFTTSGLSDKTPGSFEFMANYIFNYDDERIQNLRFF